MAISVLVRVLQWKPTVCMYIPYNVYIIYVYLYYLYLDLYNILLYIPPYKLADPAMLKISFQPRFKWLRTRRADSINSSPKAWDLRRAKFQFESKRIKRLMFKLKWSGRRSSLLLWECQSFYPIQVFNWLEEGHLYEGGALGFTHSTYSNGNLIQKRLHSTPRKMAKYLGASSNWHIFIKLNFTLSLSFYTDFLRHRSKTNALCFLNFMMYQAVKNHSCKAFLIDMEWRWSIYLSSLMSWIGKIV